MSFWKKLFGSVPPEERRSGANAYGRKYVSCMDVVRAIRTQVAAFQRDRGMAIVLIEDRDVQIYFFDGIARTSWNYTNGVLTTDRVGEALLIRPRTDFTLTEGTETLLAPLLQKEFAHCDNSAGSLWRLDPTAPDYEQMKIRYANHIAVRISFDRLPEQIQ